MADQITTEGPKKSLFFVKNPGHNTKSLELYLERRDFIVQSESLLSDALTKIQNLKPNYIFIAWDHKDPELHQFLSQAQIDDTLIIPFITSTSTSETRKLNQLNVPVKLYPPLSGPAIQRTILKYEKEKNNLKKNQTNNLISNSIGNESHSKQIFINKGQRFKDLNTITQSGLSMGKIHQLGLELETDDIEYSSFFDSITDLTLDTPKAQFSKSLQIKISEFQKQSVANLFDAQIKNELTEIIETLKADPDTSPEKSSYCILIHSIDCSGLVLLHSEWGLNDSDAASALSTWGKALVSYFYKNEITDISIFQSEIINLNISKNVDLSEICTLKSAVQKELIIDNKKTLLAFFDLAHNPFNLQPTEDQNYLSIDPACLQIATTINFDLYLKLKENKKIIKYVKENTYLSEKEIKSLMDKKNIPLMIHIENETVWYKYGAESYLQNL